MSIPEDRYNPSSEENSNSVKDEDIGPYYRSTDEERNLYFSNQKDLHDLIRDLGQTKSTDEHLTSRLKQWELLDEVEDQWKHH